MTYNPEIHRRRSIRLKGYDYAQAGAYFVTICTWNKECLFGEIANGTSKLNKYGEMVMKCWNEISGHFFHVKTDEFIIMPNHIHGIITINNVGAQFIAPFGKTTSEKLGVINHAPTIGGVVRSFKARCTYMINQLRDTPGTPVWQRNYYERVIRDDRELYSIREYIRYNPLKWDEDEENPVIMRTIQKNA